MRLNDTPRVELEITTGRDVTFAVEWWVDEARTTPVAIASVLCKVKADAESDVVLLDLGATATIDGGTATLHALADATALLEPLERGVWDFALISEAGETKQVCRGNARIHAGIS